ncbi:unnamed protein product [Peronospora belbahrii]|uniref:Uncharacterized protein n=1 Tax=Peronospora belbahrii TaxID=622444 RepID=A0ABN8DDA4_9STRA|nr:unnamed protein product [Peronospora belbahrii]
MRTFKPLFDSLRVKHRRSRPNNSCTEAEATGCSRITVPSGTRDNEDTTGRAEEPRRPEQGGEDAAHAARVDRRSKPEKTISLNGWPLGSISAAGTSCCGNYSVRSCNMCGPAWNSSKVDRVAALVGAVGLNIELLPHSGHSRAAHLDPGGAREANADILNVKRAGNTRSGDEQGDLVIRGKTKALNLPKCKKPKFLCRNLAGGSFLDVSEELVREHMAHGANILLVIGLARVRNGL